MDDDDTQRLASPISKRRSVVKMLQKQLARERRASAKTSTGPAGSSRSAAGDMEMSDFQQHSSEDNQRWRNYGATSQSDTEDSSPSHSSQTPNDNDSSRPNQRVRVQLPDEHWTIRDNSYFVYGPSFRGGRQQSSGRQSIQDWWHEMWSPYGGFHRLTSVWIYVSLGLLLLANCFNLASFTTNNWGILRINHPNINVTTPHAAVKNDTSALRWVRNAWDDVKDTVAEELGYERAKRDKSDTPSESPPRHVVNRMWKPQATQEYWRFGLWQCCRNTDGLCLGIRWTAFYSATRAFSVMALFGMILSFAWMLGHTLEKLLDYDVCTMSCLISLCYATSLFSFVSVVLFGIRWPRDFRNEFDGTDPQLSFSFYLALFTVPMTLTAAICSTIDLKRETENYKRRHTDYYSDSELAYIDQDLPTDNISRPRGLKKKRTMPAGRGRYAATGHDSTV